MNKKLPRETLPDDWNPGLLPGQGFAPLTLEWKPFRESSREWDALVNVCVENGETVQFATLYQRDATPRQITFSAMQIASRAQRDNVLPLLVIPYLPEQQLLELEQSKISALDLCGNGIVRAPGQFYVFRTGYPNRFTSSRPLKNIYRGVSSLVARAFLLTPQYAEIRELQQEIARRGGAVTLPTLSKVLTELEEDVIVQRSRQADKPQSRALRLLQPGKLLSRLEENYAPPKINSSFLGKVAMEPEALRLALRKNAHEDNTRLIATGLGSAGRYATLAMENTLYVYTSSLDTLLQNLPATATTRFPNLSVQQTEDPSVFFDPRPDEAGFSWASPVTSYLELMQGEERLRQTATQIREALLAALTEVNA